MSASGGRGKPASGFVTSSASGAGAAPIAVVAGMARVCSVVSGGNSAAPRGVRV